MSEKRGIAKKSIRRAEAFGLGFFYAGMLAVFLYAILNLINPGVL